MQVVPIPCLRDNYAYLVVCEQTRKAIVVDPSQAGPIIAAVKTNRVALTAIWNTHHHWDHTGGNERLLEEFDPLEVIGHASDKGRIPGQTVFVNDGDSIVLGETITANIIHNPGHTNGAISFYVTESSNAESSSVFTGDTLFASGCGRRYEGTPEQMHTSLQRLASLPGETTVYCGHEYMQNNLRFASTIEPDNINVRDSLAKVTRHLELGQPVPPSTIEQERKTNPFLRTSVEDVVNSANKFAKKDLGSPAEVFGALRRWKDHF